MKVHCFNQKSTKYSAVLSFWNFFEKYRGTFDFQVPVLLVVLTKYRTHLCQKLPLFLPSKFES